MRLLGILKAGGAYVPLDPGYPADRLAYMMADAASRSSDDAGGAGGELAVVSRRGAGVFGPRLEEAIGHESRARPGATRLTRRLQRRQRIWPYVIYTSGSTGQPERSDGDA